MILICANCLSNVLKKDKTALAIQCLRKANSIKNTMKIKELYRQNLEKAMNFQKSGKNLWAYGEYNRLFLRLVNTKT